MLTDTFVVIEVTEIIFGKTIVSLSEFDKRDFNVVKVEKLNEVPTTGVFEELKVMV